MIILMDLFRYVIPITMCFCFVLSNYEQEHDDNQKQSVDTIIQLHGEEFNVHDVEHYEGAGDGHDDDLQLNG